MANPVCSACRCNYAAFVCACDFPVTPICSAPECTEQHRAKARFHYFQPVEVYHYITRENYNQCIDWFFQLNKTQVQLEKEIETVYKFEQELNSAFQAVEALLAATRTDYLQALQSLKDDLRMKVAQAIDETRKFALFGKHRLISELSDYVWETAEKREAAVLEPILTARIRVPDQRDLLRFLGFALKSKTLELPGLPNECIACQALTVLSDFCSAECRDKLRPCLNCGKPIPFKLEWPSRVPTRLTTHLRIPVEFCSRCCFYNNFAMCRICSVHVPVRKSQGTMEMCDECVRRSLRENISRGS